MRHKPEHTFTWLKVFTCFILIEIILISIGLGFLDNLKYSWFIIWVALTPALLGLGIGIAINFLTKFKWPVRLYISGYLLSVLICIAFLYIQFRHSPFVHFTPYEEPLSSQEITGDTTDTNTIFRGDEKYAIEEVIYLMEQQYPFGAYVLNDIITKTESNGIVCTIVFSLPEEDNKKYISQYIVTTSGPEPVYLKRDTTSTGFLEYKLEKTGQ